MQYAVEYLGGGSIMLGNFRRWLALVALSALAIAAAQPVTGQALPDLDVPYVTTPDRVVNSMLTLAGVTARDFVLDLGSGDGRIVIMAAAKYGARGMGVEIDPALVQLSNENASKAGVAERARFVEQDLFATDLGQATVITMYLLPDVNLKLRPELLKLRPGTRIVSHDWDMGDWQPDGKLVLDVPEKKLGLEKKSTLLLWKVPAAVDGNWSSGKRLRLNLRQRYQMLEGAVTYRGQTYADASGRVDGTRVYLCFTHRDTGPCRLGAAGQVIGGELRLLIDGDGRQQITTIARKENARYGR
jgi:SAM-dependent methyltransferase